jgi:replicative DNA helicase
VIAARATPLAAVPTKPAADPGAGLLAAERAATGAALHGTDPARTVLDLLRPKDLYDRRLKDVLTAVQTVLRRGQSPDLHLVRAELVRTLGPQQTSDADQLLLELHAAVPLPAQARAYAVEVLAAAWRRRITTAATRFAQAADSSNDDDLAELIDAEYEAVEAARLRYRLALAPKETPA